MPAKNSRLNSGVNLHEQERTQRLHVQDRRGGRDQKQTHTDNRAGSQDGRNTRIQAGQNEAAHKQKGDEMSRFGKRGVRCDKCGRFSNKYFVMQGQYGIKEAIDVENYGGLWMRLYEPSVPSGNAANPAQSKSEASVSGRPSKGALRAAAACIRTPGLGTDVAEQEFAWLIDSETGLPELLEALKPFVEVAAELATIGFVFREDQWLWKPSNNTRDTKGINAQHIIDAANILSKAERGADK